MKRGILTSLLTVIMFLSGCGPSGYLLYVFFPWAGERTVEAEFSDLKNKSVAVVVYADENAQYIYPPLQLELSAFVSAELQKHLKGVTAIDPRKIVAYQRSNLAWDELSFDKIGQDLDADYVLFVSLVEFSTVEEGYLDLLRAKISGEVSLYDASKDSREARVWKGEDIHVAFPETPAARVANNEQKYRMIAMQMFAQQLGKKFYDHKEKIEK